MKKHLLIILALVYSVTSYSQIVGEIVDQSAVLEYSLTKSSIDFGDIYIQKTELDSIIDSLYIVAPITNTGNMSIKIVFDEDRNVECPIINGPPVSFYTKNIFQVLVDDVRLSSISVVNTFPIDESDLGNTTVTIAPGDSVQVKIFAQPGRNTGTIDVDNGGQFPDCVFGENPINSLGFQSDAFTITNLSLGEKTPSDSSVSISFTGVNDEEVVDPNGLFDFSDKENLSIYPNPATSIINTEVGSLEILDLTGSLVLSTESTGQVDVSDLSSGIYLVSQNGKRTKLIVE